MNPLEELRTTEKNWRNFHGESVAYFLSDEDARLEGVGIRIGDCEILDPEVFIGNAQLSSLWALGQVRDFAHTRSEGVFMHQMMLSWHYFAQEILEQADHGTGNS